MNTSEKPNTSESGSSEKPNTKRQPTIKEIGAKFRKVHQNCWWFPNLYALSYKFETDLLRVTRNMYAYEYEIKHSLQDLIADRRKKGKHDAYMAAYQQRAYSKKIVVPKEFWYVLAIGTKMGELTSEQVAKYVPDYAGIIYAERYESGWISLDYVRSAKKLSSVKISESHYKRLMEKMYYNLWNRIDKEPKI